MKKSLSYRIFMLICTVAMGLLVSCSDSEPEDHRYRPTTPIGRTLESECDAVARMFADTTFVVAVGVDETDLHLQLMSGYVVRMFLLRVDTTVPGLELRVALPDNNNDLSQIHTQTLTDMAAVHDAPGKRVVAMTNGDFWDTANVLPRGPIHRDGYVLNDRFNYSESVPQQALSFVGIRDDGSMIIAEASRYAALQSQLKEVTGAGVILLSEGLFPGTTFTARDPRTAIGYTDDGIVYMLTVDGRRNFYSDGITYEEMASVFKALDCTGAVNLDGGGSAQMLIRHPIAQIFQIRNRPSDNAERPVYNGWMVCVEEP